MKKRRETSIPSDAEFEAASKAMAARMDAEKSLKAKILNAHGDCPILHDVYVWISKKKCHVDLFVHSDVDISSPRAEGLKSGVVTLLSVQYGDAQELSVDLDSHERVVREFNGNYFKRFR